MKKEKHPVCCFLLTFVFFLLTVGVRAQESDGWMDSTLLKLKNTEFEFSRSESDVPFLPVLSLRHTEYGKNTFTRTRGDQEDIEFRSRNTAAYAMVPIYVGKKSIALAVPYVSYTHFAFTEGPLKDRDVTGLNLVLGGAVQTSPGQQWGGFIMPSAYSPLTDNAEWAGSGWACVAGRSLQGERTVWYYGLVYDYAFSDGFFLPYLGFSYIIDPCWAISLVAPWPAINYAPSDSLFFKLGVSPSGSSWTIDPKGDDSQVVGSLGAWDFGFWAEKRVYKSVWFNFGVGYSGLKSFEFNTQGDTEFDPSLKSEPFVSIAINIRPGKSN
ncbi:MAG: hypothetical protein PHP44_03625 [Kiritimatiellae bacterium]|nr:hypothetical protein [Kiritimatiellia bacterium]